MKHVIQHDLDMATAKKVTDHAFAEYRSRYPDYEPSLTWVNDRRADLGFNARGVKLGGAMTIAEGEIALELDVPFLLRPFQTRAVEVIEREVRLWIGKAKKGEL
jgi:hypothetical protein